MTPETLLANQISLWCGEHNWIIIRQQSGVFYTKYGQPIRIGFEGLSDYLIITNTGIPIFVETKIHPRRPTQQQLNFINKMNSINVRAFVCYNINEFIERISDLI